MKIDLLVLRLPQWQRRGTAVRGSNNDNDNTLRTVQTQCRLTVQSTVNSECVGSGAGAEAAGGGAGVRAGATFVLTRREGASFVLDLGAVTVGHGAVTLACELGDLVL